VQTAGPPLAYTQAAFDPHAGVTIVSGLTTGDVSDVEASTWVYSATQRTWVQRLEGLAPQSAGPVRLTYDSGRKRVVMCHTANNRRIWEWDGARWHSTPAPGPAMTAPGTAVAYHSASKRTVLFGGPITTPPYFTDETWEWDGGSWRMRNPSTKPPPRMEHVLVDDTARGTLLLYGGSIFTPTPR
jgi:hypothetical protein